jgi:hypothetical protein
VLTKSEIRQLTVVMIDRLGREGSDSKCVGEHLDGPSRCAVLARSKDARLRGLRFWLHGILNFSTKVNDTHKER